jgi:hypothetical protein
MFNFIVPICIAISVFLLLNATLFSEKWKAQRPKMDSSKYLLFALLFVLFFYKQIIKLEPVSLICSIVVVAYFVFKSYESYKNSKI